MHRKFKEILKNIKNAKGITKFHMNFLKVSYEFLGSSMNFVEFPAFSENHQIWLDPPSQRLAGQQGGQPASQRPSQCSSLAAQLFNFR